jgi:hypothetical protein
MPTETWACEYAAGTASTASKAKYLKYFICATPCRLPPNLSRFLLTSVVTRSIRKSCLSAIPLECKDMEFGFDFRGTPGERTSSIKDKKLVRLAKECTVTPAVKISRTLKWKILMGLPWL